MMFLTCEDPIAVVRSLALQRAARVVVVAPSAVLGAAVAPTTNRRSVASAAVSSRVRCDARERSDATVRGKWGPHVTEGRAWPRARWAAITPSGQKPLVQRGHDGRPRRRDLRLL